MSDVSPLAGEVTVAAVQMTPVFLDREATVDLLVGHLKEAAAQGAPAGRLPEAILPGYPDWVWRRPAWADREWYGRLFDQAVDIAGPATDRLGEAAREAGAWVAVGVTERVRSGTLYNTLLYLDPDGQPDPQTKEADMADRVKKNVETPEEVRPFDDGTPFSPPCVTQFAVFER
jgi:predicted amidohydrolase